MNKMTYYDEYALDDQKVTFIYHVNLAFSDVIYYITLKSQERIPDFPKGTNLLFGQNFLKIVWKWRNFRPGASKIQLCRSAIEIKRQPIQKSLPAKHYHRK